MGWRQRKTAVLRHATRSVASPAVVIFKVVVLLLLLVVVVVVVLLLLLLRWWQASLLVVYDGWGQDAVGRTECSMVEAFHPEGSTEGNLYVYVPLK